MNDVDDFIDRHEQEICDALDKAELERIIEASRWKLVAVPEWAKPDEKPPIIDEKTGGRAPVTLVANTLPPSVTDYKVSWQETQQKMERVMELCKRTGSAILIQNDGELNAENRRMRYRRQ